MTTPEVILAIEASGAACTVALAVNHADIIQERRDEPHAASMFLDDMTARCLSSAGFKPSAISQLIVNRGPGSFTGLRVALSYARGLAVATGIPIAGLSQLDLLRHLNTHAQWLQSCNRTECYLSTDLMSLTLETIHTVSDKLNPDRPVYSDQPERFDFLPKPAERYTPDAEQLIHCYRDRSDSSDLSTDIIYFHHFKAS